MLARAKKRLLAAIFKVSLVAPQMAQIKTFAFLDLETTGLPWAEGNKTKITEITVLTVQSSHIALGVMPRVQNKLTLCVYPRKMVSPESERITGLSNDILEHMAPFSSETVQMINGFLNHCPKPICFVAHNGNRFDYPILQRELHLTGAKLLDDILCIDSLEAFRELYNKPSAPVVVPQQERTFESTGSVLPIEFQDGFDELLCKAVDDFESGPEKRLKYALEVQKINETTPKKVINNVISNGNLKVSGLRSNEHGQKVKKSLNFGVSFKLVDVYKRLTNQEPMEAHHAEGDVLMLALCAATLGDTFIEWANCNKKYFCDIPKMEPGKRIGM
ncbi:uncharacterized protein LOC126735342 [Anthonomus grandis grandis]|uniref:uncharacterized protein LOC126735342 n=1 Tax=Anthonomus grandis grandis TaxID=2921223 RepID=UPI0021652391|nr:uncharacterized protein LOC126735342 [Anthonomus grandis grandis]